MTATDIYEEKAVRKKYVLERWPETDETGWCIMGLCQIIVAAIDERQKKNSKGMFSIPATMLTVAGSVVFAVRFAHTIMVDTEFVRLFTGGKKRSESLFGMGLPQINSKRCMCGKGGAARYAERSAPFILTIAMPRRSFVGSCAALAIADSVVSMIPQLTSFVHGGICEVSSR